jgi:hypothetical protein
MHGHDIAVPNVIIHRMRRFPLAIATIAIFMPVSKPRPAALTFRPQTVIHHDRDPPERASLLFYFEKKFSQFESLLSARPSGFEARFFTRIS